MLNGKDSKHSFNGMVFNSQDRQGKDITMMGIYKDSEYKSGTTRSGWFMGRQFKFPELIAGTKETFAFGDTDADRIPFIVYLDKQPLEFTGTGDAPRYNVRACNVVGIEIPE